MKRKLIVPRRLAGLLSLCAGLVFVVLLAGCESVKTYSIRSHTGPMPMEDQHYVEAWH